MGCRIPDVDIFEERARRGVMSAGRICFAWCSDVVLLFACGYPIQSIYNMLQQTQDAGLNAASTEPRSLLPWAHAVRCCCSLACRQIRRVTIASRTYAWLARSRNRRTETDREHGNICIQWCVTKTGRKLYNRNNLHCLSVSDIDSFAKNFLFRIPTANGMRASLMHPSKQPPTVSRSKHFKPSPRASIS